MSLKYLFDQPDLNARKTRWLYFLSEYHFKLNHIKGKENKVADALSHRTHMIYEVTLSQTDADLHEKIRETITRETMKHEPYLIEDHNMKKKYRNQKKLYIISSHSPHKKNCNKPRIL